MVDRMDVRSVTTSDHILERMLASWLTGPVKFVARKQLKEEEPEVPPTANVPENGRKHSLIIVTAKSIYPKCGSECQQLVQGGENMM